MWCGHGPGKETYRAGFDGLFGHLNEGEIKLARKDVSDGLFGREALLDEYRSETPVLGASLFFESAFKLL